MRLPSRALARRIRTIPGVFVVAAGLTAALLLVPLALIFDGARWAITRRPFMASRLLVFGWLYATLDFLAVLALGLSWVAAGFGVSTRVLHATTYALQRWWARALFGSFRLVFRVGLDVDSDEVIAPGPVIVMMRHASLVDTLLPILIAARHGITLRYVLKRELLIDPALDIAGNRIPNHFIDRTGESAGEVTKVRDLAVGLGAGEGVLIYPEGTRFTPEKRRRALKRLERTEEALHARAEAMKQVLPPRPGGALALLDAPADVVIGMHTGLESLGTVKDAWSGRVVGSTVRVALARFDGASIPSSRRERMLWLYERWAEVDAWISEQ